MERDVPVLFVSGYAEELVDMPEDLSAATAFMAKPFTPEQLLDQVHKMLAVARSRGGAIADGDRSSSHQPQLKRSSEVDAPRQ
jgi:FixJ family two-component response regulator